MTQHDPASPPRAPRINVRVVIVALVVVLLAYQLGVRFDLFREISNWYVAIAAERAARGDAEGAAQANHMAAEWKADNAAVVRQQVGFLLQNGDRNGALRVLDEALKHPPSDLDGRIDLLMTRCELLQLAGRHQAAIADASLAASLADKGSPLKLSHQPAEMRNNRAYVIARAGAARKASPDQLLWGMADMQVAFDALQRQRSQFKPGDVGAALELAEREAMYLDTLAYLELARNNLPEALRDFNRSAQLLQSLLALWESHARSGIEAPRLPGKVSDLYHHLAVVLHHRGEALRALGNQAGAERDFETARQLGYDPNAGRW